MANDQLVNDFELELDLDFDFDNVEKQSNAQEEAIEEAIEEANEANEANSNFTELDKALLAPVKLLITDTCNVTLLCINQETNTYKRVSGQAWHNKLVEAPSPISGFNTMLEYASYLLDHWINNPQDVEGEPIGFARNNDGGWRTTPNHLSQYYTLALNIIADYPKYLFLKEPEIFTNDPNEINYNFFDLNKITEGDHPHWDEFLTKMPSKEYEHVFCAYIYSIFYAKNNASQMLYLRDNGGQGKSHVMMAIMNVLGDNICTTGDGNELSSSNAFALEHIHGKHLYIVDDNKNPVLVKSARMHSILAGAKMNVNRKGLAVFNGYIKVKAIIGSNEKPLVDVTAPNETRRMIYIPLGDYPDYIKKKIYKVDDNGELVKDDYGNLQHIGDGKKQFKYRLEDELLHFLYTCKKSYDLRCPKNGNIDQTGALTSLYDDCIDPITDVYENIMNKFEPDITRNVSALELRKIFSIQLEFNGFKADETAYRNFIKWMRTNYPHVKAARIKKTSCYKGITLKKSSMEKIIHEITTEVDEC